MTSFRMFALPLTMFALLAAPRLAAGADEGEKVFKETCSGCHDANTRPLDAVRLTRQQWKEAVERMESNGAEIPRGKKMTDLLDYLERTHGPQSPPPAGK